jgi:hypothetical protein
MHLIASLHRYSRLTKLTPKSPADETKTIRSNIADYFLSIQPGRKICLRAPMRAAQNWQASRDAALIAMDAASATQINYKHPHQ